MSTNAITQLEQNLISLLKEEYAFYQSLYVLLDKQRDLIQYDKEEHLLDLYVEIERCQRRIFESEKRITGLKDANQQMFRIAAAHPEVKKLVNSIATLVRKNMRLISENKEYAVKKHERIREELDQLKQSDKILRYLHTGEVAPQFIDGHR